MNIILLSGGSGTRLWPLSNEVRSKQFLKIFRQADGTHESMAQRMYRMIKQADGSATVTVATSENQIPQIRAQLGESVGISAEPCRRDTFPAIALACAYLKKNGTDENEPVVVCPVDPFVNEDYFECLKTLSSEAGKSNLTLMGIEPDEPSEKYGYIIPETKDNISAVREFREKPDRKTAEKYIEQGALWNGGIFAFRLGYMLSVAENRFGFSSYDEILENYANLDKISIDYAVAEKEKDIRVIRFNGQWKDLGTWNSLTEAMTETVGGNATAAGCDNTHIVNELGIPLVVLGMKDAVVAATPDGILVADKEMSSGLKDYVEKHRPMYECREWGEYRVLNCTAHDNSENSLVKELVIAPGRHISYQVHRLRTEMWAVTEGCGEVIINGEVRKIGRGDSIVIKPGTNHAVKALTELHIIEVQLGDELTEEDIVRLDWNWQE